MVELNRCRGCGKLLVPANLRIADGCPCNAACGINHGLVPKATCTCHECDPAQTGSTRYPLLEVSEWDRGLRVQFGELELTNAGGDIEFRMLASGGSVGDSYYVKSGLAEESALALAAWLVAAVDVNRRRARR